jgi:protein phosphatase inhibitor 2
MHLARLQGPLQRAAACSGRPFNAVLRTTTRPTTTTLEDRFAQLRIASPATANAAVEGRRYASVKSQGAYRLKSKKTIAKKMGAKKTGGMSCSIARRQLAVPENWMLARQRCALLIRPSTP